MFEFIKNIRRRKILRTLKALPRQKRIENIQNIKTIGIICRFDNEQNWNILNRFATVMENQDKKVSIIGLHEQTPRFVVSRQGTTVCRAKKDLNFWGIPSWGSIKGFVSEKYDLLIDTVGTGNFFAQYVALRTTADLKVVYANPTENPTETYDLIIRGDGQMELKGFFNNVIEYLGMINK